jgi:hypothetical protein
MKLLKLIKTKRTDTKHKAIQTTDLKAPVDKIMSQMIFLTVKNSRFRTSRAKLEER